MRNRFAAGMLAGALMALLAPAAEAATINVDTTADEAGTPGNGFCSLREAIISAEDNDNTHELGCVQGQELVPDTIELDADTYILTIPAVPANDDVTGDLDHKSIASGQGGDLNVVGAGQDDTIIDANDIDRAFDLGNYAFSFTDLTIRDGDALGSGGAIALAGAIGPTKSLALTDVTVSSSEVAGNGGAISFNDGSATGSLTVTDSIIDGNKGGGSTGGGIQAVGVDTVTITGSAITGNQLLNPGAGGGGLYLQGTGSIPEDYDVTDTTISGNTGAGDGGGIFASGTAFGTLTVTRSLIAGNDAVEEGGGIKTGMDTTEVIDSIVRDNDATGGAPGIPTGGGIDTSGATDLDVIRSTLAGNTSDFRGGAIDFGGDALRVLNSTISGNSATSGSAVQVRDGTGVTGAHEALFNHATVSGNTGTSAIRTESDDDPVTINLGESILDQPEAAACEAVVGTEAASYVSKGGNFDRGTTCSDGSDDQTTDTNLGSLAANGGTAAGSAGSEEELPTHELPPDSDAVDAIAAASCTDDGTNAATQDQRGFPRPYPVDCDSGAYELQAVCQDRGATILGTAAAETLTGTGGSDVIAGLDGADTINGLGGDDLLCGDADDDTINGGADDDVLDGGLGSNTASFAGGAGVTVTYTSDVAATATGQGSDTLTGGDFSTATGSSFADTVNGPPSTPFVFNPGDGDDVFNGGNDDNVVSASAGDDVLNGGSAVDTFEGGPGDDVLNGGAGDDELEGQDDDDTISGGTGNEDFPPIDGGAGNDTASYAGAPASVTVFLTGGASGGDDNDGFVGIENLTGSSFHDALGGDAGDNRLIGGPGDDQLDGLGDGAAGDTADYSNAAGAVNANLSSGTSAGGDGDGATDTLTAIENLVGSPAADTLGGNGSDNTLDGGSGNDTADYSDAAGPVIAGVATGTTAGGDGDGMTDTFTAIENLTGSAFGDDLTGSGAVNVLSGLGGDDVLRSQDGGVADTDDCGPGTDTAVRDVQDTQIACESSVFPAAGLPGGPPVVLTPNPTAPANAFSFGKLKRNKKKGIGFLFVNVPGPGTVSIAGKGVRPLSRGTGGGAVKLKVAPHKKGKQARKLRKRLQNRGKAGLKLRVTFVPTGGAANTQPRKLKLIRKRKK